ncbi:LuxR C-terminal-related transcriptional regulator [Nocardia sp. NPDC003482]
MVVPELFTAPARTAHAAPILTFTPLRMPDAQLRLDRAGRAGNGHTVLVRAPAGSGKTVLVAEWAGRQRPSTAVRWIGVADIGDARLWSAVAEALRLAPLAPTGPVPDTPVEEAARICAALSESAAPTVLVIDDAHLLSDPLALAGLEYFVEHAPATLTTVVIGRFDPPLRWHALQMTARLTRIEPQHLQFDVERTAALLDQHDCRLTDAELAAFHELTRGWAGLVRIGALHLAAYDGDRATAITALAHGPHAVADFLVGELLAALAPAELDFLLSTAVPGAFSVELARRLAGPTAAGTLETLLRNSFPLEAVARGGELWYTCHPMLRAYLLAEIARTAPDRAAALHRDCAHWFAEAGMLPEALHHVLAEPDHPALTAFVRERGPRMVFEGDGPALWGRLERVGPLADDVFVLVLRTADAVERADLVAATALAELVRDRRDAESRVAATDLVRAFAEAVVLAVDLAVRLAVDAPAGPPPATGHADIDCYIALQTATARLYRPSPRGDAEPGLRHALALARSAGLDRLTMQALTRLAAAAGMRGALALMDQRARQAVAFADGRALDDPTAPSQARIMIALLAYLRAGERPGASVGTVPSTQRIDGSIAPAPGWHAEVLARLFDFDTATDRHAVADALRHGMQRLLDEAAPAATTAGLLVHVTWVLLRVRWYDAAQRLLGRARAVLGRVPETVLAEAALAEAQRSPATTAELVEPLLERDDRLHPVSAIQAWLLYAAACSRLDRPAAAHDALRRACALAYTDRLIRPFLDVPGIIELLDQYMGRFGYLDEFVDTIRRRGRAETDSQATELTTAEIAVLRQLPSGMTAHSIATDMGVSINTVKTHLRGIYRKLGVRTRADAISRARSLGTI